MVPGQVNIRNSTADVLLGIGLSVLLGIGAWTVQKLMDIDQRLARVEATVQAGHNMVQHR
jgi:cytochrome oxidase assembly protein ShyY1